MIYRKLQVWFEASPAAASLSRVLSTLRLAADWLLAAGALAASLAGSLAAALAGLLPELADTLELLDWRLMLGARLTWLLEISYSSFSS